jgi:hypothetical protein
MNLIENSQSDLKRNRDFGLLMALVFSILGGALLWKGSANCLYLFALASVFLLAAIYVPLGLSPLEKAWMKFAEKLSVVMTYFLVTLSFFVAIVPMSILLRLLGKDLLGLALEPEKGSYWEPVEVDGPGTRPYTPY